jgi:hypothetical protein
MYRVVETSALDLMSQAKVRDNICSTPLTRFREDTALLLASSSCLCTTRLLALAVVELIWLEMLSGVCGNSLLGNISEGSLLASHLLGRSLAWQVTS